MPGFRAGGAPAATLNRYQSAAPARRRLALSDARRTLDKRQRSGGVQDARAATFAGFGFMASHSNCRKLHHKQRAFAWLAFAPHTAVHGFDHLFDDGQSQARGGFAAGGFRAEPREFAEEFLLVVRAQARSFILDLATNGLG